MCYTGNVTGKHVPISGGYRCFRDFLYFQRYIFFKKTMKGENTALLSLCMSFTVNELMYQFRNRADIELNCVLYRSNVASKFVQPCRPNDGLVYYISGGHIFDFGTYKIECGAGGIIYIPHGASYTNYTLSDNTEYYQIDFMIRDGNCPVVLFDKLTRLDKNRESKYTSLFIDTHNRYVKRDLAYVPYCIGNILKLISIFSAEGIEKKNTNYGIGRIAKTLTYINEFYNKNTTVTELAGISSTSVSNLEKTFKQCFNMSPSAYRNKIRIEYAKQFLAGGYSIEKVAYLTGFSDRFYFSKIFKKFTGTSPREFMNSYEI